MSQHSPINRRRFFREGFRELLKPLAELAEPLEEAARHFAETSRASAAASRRSAHRRVPLDVWLRPPGALPEAQFRQTCSRCGDCVDVCPARCIKLDPAGKAGDGVPYIDIDTMPCVVCDGLYCMHKCPTGALVPTPLSEIDMGTAVWHERSCLRSRATRPYRNPPGAAAGSVDDADCTICIDQCPLGSAAIELRDGRVHVIEEGCIGCGVCEYYCPTTPRSITITPRRDDE